MFCDLAHTATEAWSRHGQRRARGRCNERLQTTRSRDPHKLCDDIALALGEAKNTPSEQLIRSDDKAELSELAWTIQNLRQRMRDVGCGVQPRESASPSVANLRAWVRDHKVELGGLNGATRLRLVS